MTTPKLKAQQGTKTGQTIAHLLIDSSGSMAQGKEETMQAFNGYIEGLHNDEITADMLISVSHFNSGVGVQVISEAVKPGDVTFLTNENYLPNGGTPLFDSIAEVIESTRKLAKAEDRVLIIIQTDGYENASNEYRHDTIKALITERQAQSNWEFIYLGKGINAMETGANMGFYAGSTISYDFASTGVAAASLSTRSAKYSAGESSSSEDGNTEDFRS